MNAAFEPSIRSLVRKTCVGDLDPLTIVDEVLHRLEMHRDNPIFISTTPAGELRQRALELGQLSPERRATLPLFGVPFAVKDNIDVAGKPTTAGCPEYAFTPTKDAFVVKRLLDAGAILVGKANLDQFATGLTGMRSVYGSPINPYSPDHICGGSSSGSGVAVACGIVSFSLGTDTAGSGRIPAGFNGIVGYRPTSGIISNSGVVPCARSLDSVSVFGNCPDDVRRVLAVAAAFDEEDPFSRHITPRPLPLSGPIIGVLEVTDEHFLGDMQARAAYVRGVERLGSLGYQIEKFDDRPFQEISNMTYFGTSMAERAAVLGDFIDAHPTAKYTPVVRDAILNSRSFSAVDTYRSLHRLQELKRQIDCSTWKRIDVLCVPTAPTIYTREQVLEDPSYTSTSLGCYTNFAPFLKLPAISVPNGFREDGLPSGLMFVSKSSTDLALLQVAETFSHHA